MIGRIAALRVDELDATAEEVQLAREVSGQERTPPPAEGEHAPLREGEQIDDGVEVVLRDHVEAGAEAVLEGRIGIAEQRVAGVAG